MGTPPDGPILFLERGLTFEADVVAVENFSELRSHAADVRGKIVLFNQPFTNYADTVSARTNSARAAGAVGAVAVPASGRLSAERLAGLCADIGASACATGVAQVMRLTPPHDGMGECARVRN